MAPHRWPRTDNDSFLRTELMPDPDAQRRFAHEVVERLRAAGHEALWAGGCVRDQLLGLLPVDYDVATGATPEQIREVFSRRRTVPVGAAFGVIAVLGRRGEGQIEVATFREDATYSDGRHPDAVTYSTAEADAQRRDFTINGLFYDPVQQQVIDYVGGQQDLAKRLVRAIGDPAERIQEDKLRMLRAVRIAATFGFEIDPATLNAVRAMAPEVTAVSPERIGGELRRMLQHRSRSESMQLLAETGLLSHVLPEAGQLADQDPGGSWKETLALLQRLSDPSIAGALAATLLHAGDENAIEVAGRRLRFTNKEISRAVWYRRQLATVRDALRVAWPKLQPVLVHEGAEELVALWEAVAGADDEAARYCRGKLALPAAELNPPPLLRGDDLIEHGWSPGKHFAGVLQAVRDAQLEQRIGSKDEALRLADQLTNER